MQPVSVTRLSPNKTRQALYNFLGDFDDYVHRITSIKLHRYEPKDPAISHIIKTVLHYNVSSTLVIAQHIYYKDGTSKKYGYTYSSYAWVLHSRVYQKWLTLSDYTEYKNGKRHGVSYRVCRENCLKSVETLYRHGKKICSLKYHSRGPTRYLKNPVVNIIDNSDTVELTKFVGGTELTKTYKLGKVATTFFLNNREIDVGKYSFIQCIVDQDNWYNLMPYDSLEFKSGQLSYEKNSVRYAGYDEKFIFSVIHRTQSSYIRVRYHREDSENGCYEYRRKISLSMRTSKYRIEAEYDDFIESESELIATDNTIPDMRLGEGTSVFVQSIKIVARYKEELVMKYNVGHVSNFYLGMDSKLYPGAPDLLTALGPGFDISSIDDSIVDFLKLQYA